MGNHVVQSEKLQREAVAYERSLSSKGPDWQIYLNRMQNAVNRLFLHSGKCVLPGFLVFAFAIVGGVFSGTARANFAYNFLQASYVFGEYELDNNDVGFTGFELTAQYEFSSSLVAGINYLSIDGADTEMVVSGVNTLQYEGEGIQAYALYYSPVTPNADWFLGYRADMREFEAGFQDNTPVLLTDDDTNFLFVGLRYQLNGLEINGQWSYLLDADDDEDRWRYTLGLISGNQGRWQLGFSVSPDNPVSGGDLMRAFVRLAY